MTLCDETSDLFRENEDDSEYNDKIQLLCSYLKFNVYNFDILKSDKENFIELCKNIPVKDRDFFYTEFMKDADLFFHDECEIEPSVMRRQQLRKMEMASEDMKGLVEAAYYVEEKALA